MATRILFPHKHCYSTCSRKLRYFCSSKPRLSLSHFDDIAWFPVPVVNMPAIVRRLPAAKTIPI